MALGLGLQQRAAQRTSVGFVAVRSSLGCAAGLEGIIPARKMTMRWGAAGGSASGAAGSLLTALGFLAIPGKFLGCQLDSSTEHVAPTPRDVVASVFELAQVQPRLWGVNRSAYRALGAWRQRRVDTAPHLTWWESTGFLGGQNPHLKG